MSSKRKSPPTKLEGGCQPTTTTATNNNNNITTTTTTISHTNLANLNQKSSNLIDKDHTIVAHIKHSDNEHFTKPLNALDCDDELSADIENNDHNNNDDDASDNCDSVTANTLTSESFDGKCKTMLISKIMQINLVFHSFFLNCQTSMNVCL